MTLPPWAVEFLRGALAAPGHKALLCCGRKNAKSAIQTMRASTRRAPRSRGVFSGIRPMASSAIRNQTWSPAGSSAPNQKVPFGSRVG